MIRLVKVIKLFLYDLCDTNKNINAEILLE